MIGVGEETGALDQMLGRSSKFLEEEIERMVESLTSLLEPLLIVILGGAVGSMVICLYLPMFKVDTLINNWRPTARVKGHWAKRAMAERLAQVLRPLPPTTKAASTRARRACHGGGARHAAQRRTTGGSLAGLAANPGDLPGCLRAELATNY